MTTSLHTLEIYKNQLSEKATKMKALFSPFNPPELEIFPSEEKHYRMRAEFRVWHEGEDLYYVMFDQNTKQKYRVDQFPTASALINQAMPKLLEKMKTSSLLRYKLFQVDFLSTLSGELLISLLYHRQLDEKWKIEAKKLKEELTNEGFKIDLIGRAKKQKFIIERDFVIEKLKVKDRTLTYQQVENSFTQPNAKVAQFMLEWALDCTKNSQDDLLELYCGNGNFSLALAQNFNRVLATELAKPSVASAQFNIAANNINNVKILRMSAEEFTQAITGQRVFRRLQDANVDLSDYNCNTIFVDPPRSGMDEETCRMVQHYDRILYISCNPETLYGNLNILSKTHTLSRIALFDQFPYTHHMEAGVLLIKK